MPTLLLFTMRRKNNYIVRNFAGDNVLVPVGSEVGKQRGMILFNNTGLYIWECLAQECTLDELVTAVANKFEIQIESSQKDVEQFISDISNLGLIEQ